MLNFRTLSLTPAGFELDDKPLAAPLLCVPLAWRPHAESPAIAEGERHRHASYGFRLARKGDVRGEPGCTFGVDILFYVPAADAYASLYLGTAPMRRKADAIREGTGRPGFLAADAAFLPAVRERFRVPDAFRTQQAQDEFEGPMFDDV